MDWVPGLEDLLALMTLSTALMNMLALASWEFILGVISGVSIATGSICADLGCADGCAEDMCESW